MASIDATNPAVKGLLDIVSKSTGPKDEKITRGEVRRYLVDKFDTNNDKFISADEANAPDITAMTSIDLSSVTGLTAKQIEQLRKAQELLKSVILEKQAPPQNLKGSALENDPLIRDPHELSCPKAMQRWSDMRAGFKG